MKKALAGIVTLAIGLLTGCAAWLGPSIDFAPSATQGPPPLAVQFKAVCDEPIASHAWTFGDGETSNDPSPVHIYRAAGTYTVSLTAELVDGSVVHEAKAALIAVRDPMLKGEPQYIYWIHVGTGAIWRAPCEGGNKEKVVGGQSYGISALDVVDGWVYWADSPDGGVICRARTDGSEQETLMTEQGYVTDIEVVPETDSIFWVRRPDFYGFEDEAYGGVFFAYLSDLQPYRLVSYAPGASRFARDVEVDVVGGNIYWTVSHFSNRTDLAGQDAIRATGTSGFAPRTVCGSVGLLWDFELDTIPGFPAEHIYWFDDSNPQLQRSDLDGSHKHAVLGGNEMTGWFAVDRLGGKIYYTTFDGIERCDLDGSHRELLYEQDAMMGIALPK